MACPDATVHFVSGMPQWFFDYNRKDLRNALELASLVKSDYLIISGMLLCDDLIKFFEPTISKIIKNGSKFIISGGGGQTYSDKEVENCRNFLKRNPPYAFISRDEVSFKNYHDLAEHSYNGIDCGFFVADYLIPADLNLSDFVVFNFDESKPHKFLRLVKQVFFSQKPPAEIPEVSGKNIIRTHHSCWPIWRNGLINLGAANSNFSAPNTLISDNPDDYLNLYARTKATYSDRVHACIATLSFGNPAMLSSVTPRSSLFNKIGADTITEKLTYPNMEKMKEEKEKYLEFLAKVLK